MVVQRFGLGFELVACSLDCLLRLPNGTDCIVKLMGSSVTAGAFLRGASTGFNRGGLALSAIQRPSPCETLGSKVGQSIHPCHPSRIGWVAFSLHHGGTAAKQTPPPRHGSFNSATVQARANVEGRDGSMHPNFSY